MGRLIKAKATPKATSKAAPKAAKVVKVVKEEMAVRTLKVVYKLNGITYLPHYEIRDTYVRPGYHPKTRPTTFSSTTLVASGAIPELYPLWDGLEGKGRY
jgi:hypothetical protein